MKMKRFILILFMLLPVAALTAGDVAQFINLGFSGDSRYFMFGQYGLDNEVKKPYAEIYLVDVPANAFVSNGVRKKVYEAALQPGQTGQGALLTSLREALPLVKETEIDHMNIGRLVYLLVNGNEPKSELTFRDFPTERTFRIKLIQKLTEGEVPEASFHINLTVAGQGGEERSYEVGLPGYSRTGVKEYRIKQVLFSPDETALVFVIEMDVQDHSGDNIRYMVETVKLD